MSSLVTSPIFMSTSSLVVELWQFYFIRHWPELIPNIWRLERIKDTKFGSNVPNKMLLNAADSVSSKLRLPRRMKLSHLKEKLSTFFSISLIWLEIKFLFVLYVQTKRNFFFLIFTSICDNLKVRLSRLRKFLTN